MAQGQRLICAAADLAEAGTGIRFQLRREGREVPAFVIRWRGQVRAYLNRCGHIPVDFSRLYLICATHGALYDPATGACLGGRCEGRGLAAVAVAERDGNIYCEES